MTSGAQPPQSGAPQPVQGVTGGPGINNGTASVDPGSGALILHPQPANVVQIRGSTPGAFEIYEYFHSLTDFSRLTLEAQTGGPFVIQTESEPTTITRNLDITATDQLILSSGGLTQIETFTNTPIIFGTNATLQWQIDGNTGAFVPFADQAVDIGNLDTLRVNATYTVNLFSNNIFPIGGGDLVIGNSGVPFWRFANDGTFAPDTTGVHDIGSGSNQVRDYFGIGTVQTGQLQFNHAAVPLAGYFTLGAGTGAPGTTLAAGWQVFVGTTEYIIPLYTP